MTTQPIDTSKFYVDGVTQPPDTDADRVGLVGLGPVPRWKRTLDVAIGTVALILLSPVMLIAAGLVLLSSPGPILFRQTRIGRGERPFAMLKFRTMYRDGHSDPADRAAFIRELEGDAIPDPASKLFRPVRDPRVTPVGRFLRRFSVDELPQLFNVLKGDMSLVGPRPALPWEVELFTREQRRRHAALPGITGLWQIHGRNRYSTREMLAFDVQYAEQSSLALDLTILMRTPRAVLLDRHTR